MPRPTPVRGTKGIELPASVDPVDWGGEGILAARARRFTRGDSYRPTLEAGPTSRKDGFEGNLSGNGVPVRPNPSVKGWGDERVDSRSDNPSDPAPAFRRHDDEDPRRLGARLEPGRARRASGGRAERAARADRRCRVREPEHVRWSDQTPNYTRLAEDGLRYNRFHVTALCSPTRAALLTGRNHHRVGFGMVGEFSGPFPGYNATIPHDCALFPRILQENGYMTGGFGKWHLTPDNQQGFSGPFDRWPTRLGFDYFWGFLGGEAGQYDPLIAENQKMIGVPEAKDGEPYYFPDDLADKTIDWLHRVRAEKPKTPWFAYVATGCSHAPHHVPREWSDKYKGAFDQGWDVMREETFARQKAARGRPADAELPPRNDAIPTWDSLDETHKRLYARQMEVYAGYSENADWNIGRIIDAIDAMGELDNTLVIWIWGDNGASMEGTLTGTFNEMTTLNGIPLTPSSRWDSSSSTAGSRPGAASSWPRTTRPAGRGPATPRSTGASRSPPTSAARGTRWSSTGRAASPTRAAVRSPLHARQRHRRDRPRARRDPAARLDRRDRAGALRRLHVRRTRSRTRPRPSGTRSSTSRSSATAAMYKDGWWFCQRLQRIPWSLDPEVLRQLRAWMGSRHRPGRALLPAGRLHRRRRTSPPSIRRRSRSCGSSSGRRRSATTYCRCSAG